MIGAAYAALTGLVCLFHLAVILGAPWGHLTMGGRWPGRLPLAARGLSLVSAVVLAGTAWVMLHPGFPALWGVIALLALGVVQHVITPSRPERALWLPVLLVMLGLALAAAYSPVTSAP